MVDNFEPNFCFHAFNCLLLKFELVKAELENIPVWSIFVA